MEQTQVGEELVQEMNKTDFGHVIYENRKNLLIALVLLIVGIVTLIGYRQSNSKNLQIGADELYSFEKSYVANYLDGKMGLNELKDAFNKLSDNAFKAPNIVPISLSLVSKMKEEGKMEEALMILEKVKSVYSSKEMTASMITYHLAVIKEDLGQFDEAISILEGLLKIDDKTFGPKLYLDLGRLYIEKGNKEMALKNLNHVLESFPGEELSGIAEVYLQKIK